MPQIARLKIELAEIEPRVMRRIEAPLDIRLDDLHLVIQAAMPWENYHLYAFSTGEGPGWGIPDPDFGGPDPMFRSAARETLEGLLAQTTGKTFHYTYDFGDDWLHVVKVEKLSEAEPGAAYPRLVAAEGACPPEDCGGPYGYANLLEAFADPEHEDHEEVTEWIGEDFDPAALDEKALAGNVASLAARLSRRPPARRSGAMSRREGGKGKVKGRGRVA